MQAPRPLRYSRQNFLTHWALVNVAKAETGGASSPTVESFCSSITDVFFSSVMMMENRVRRDRLQSLR
jgi:hypothetical protein